MWISLESSYILLESDTEISFVPRGEMSFKWIGLFIIVIFELTKISDGHSWLACTDYALKNAADYDHSLCRGYPRGANKLAMKNDVFGRDTGFNHQPQDGSQCQVSRNDGEYYDDTHQKAVYYPGQQVVLAHPMKNHGADVKCTNKFIPDNWNAIYRTARDATQDPVTLNEFRNLLVAKLGVSPVGNNVADAVTSQYPKPGYQNAPKFCENTDKSLGTYSFNVPSDLEPGEYTFMWLWEFNKESFYTNCFEVTIVANLQARNEELTARGFGTYEPCGGLTSDGVTIGNSNPGCTSGIGTPSPGPVMSSTTSTTTPGQIISSTATTRLGSTTSTTTPGQIIGTSTTTTATTTTSKGEQNLEVQGSSLSGDIVLPPVPAGVTERKVSVAWNCESGNANARFWNCGDVETVDGTYFMWQKNQWELTSRKISYYVSFNPACNNIEPQAKLISED